MIVRKAKLNAIISGSIIGLALSISQVSAQGSIVPTDFAVAEPEQAPVSVMAPLPPNRAVTATSRPVRRVAAATPRVTRPSPDRVAYIARENFRPVSVSWPFANRPSFLWVGSVY